LSWSIRWFALTPVLIVVALACARLNSCRGPESAWAFPGGELEGIFTLLGTTGGQKRWLGEEDSNPR
jgi:hypothetical protein